MPNYFETVTDKFIYEEYTEFDPRANVVDKLAGHPDDSGLSYAE